MFDNEIGKEIEKKYIYKINSHQKWTTKSLKMLQKLITDAFLLGPTIKERMIDKNGQ